MTMKNGLIFANARAKALEQNLFSEDRLLRMMECATLDDAVKILLEANYAGGMVIDSSTEFEKLLLEEQRLATDFVRSVVEPSVVGLDCFFLKNDYHNLKSLLKAKYANISDASALFMPDGNIPLSELKEQFDGGKLKSRYMADAVKTVEKKFEQGEGTPRFIDVTADVAMFKDLNERLTKSPDPLIKDYFVSLIDTTNISSMMRVYNIGANINFFESVFIEGGTIPLSKFAECFSDPTTKLSAALRGTKYGDLATKIESNSSFETAQDNYLLKLMSVKKTDMFTVAPIVGYYLAKLNEVKAIRVVLVCIKNGVDRQEMKRRVRQLYA